MSTTPATPSAPAVSIRKMPAYIPATWIYDVAERSEHVVRYHLKKLGIGEVIGAKLVISKLDLRTRWPSVYGLIEAALVAGKFDPPTRPKRQPPRRKKAADAARAEPTVPETVRSRATPDEPRDFLQVALRTRAGAPAPVLLAFASGWSFGGEGARRVSPSSAT
jgi:hypothetical protein